MGQLRSVNVLSSFSNLKLCSKVFPKPKDSLSLNQIDSQEFCTFDSRFETMYIALYSAFYSEETLQYLKATIAYLEQNGHRFTIIHRLKKQLQAENQGYTYFDEETPLKKDIDFLFSIGGDGTILKGTMI